MRTLLLAFLLVYRCALAQLDDVAFVGSLTNESSAFVFTPTNIAGYPALSWYVADDTYTNGSTLILPDRWTNSWNLTNMAASSTWPVSLLDVTNSHRALRFDGSATYIKNASYTSSQPHEVWIALRLTNNPATAGVIMDSVSGSYRNQIYKSAGNSTFGFYAGSDVASGSTTLNEDSVFGVLFNGAGSVFTTNNVSMFTGNTGSQTISGITIGSRFGQTLFANMQVFEIVTFNTNLSAGVRTNLYNYLRSRY